MFLVVSYDIVDNRRRNRVAKLMESFGDRVQWSVFECNMEADELNRMLRRLQKEVDLEKDKIRIYKLCAACKSSAAVIGKGKLSEDPDLVIV